MNLWKILFRFSGWKFEIRVEVRDKCVICVAPHTSNWDFLIGLFAYRSIGRKANFLMKDFWFFFPLKYLLRALGGIPVPRKRKGSSLTSMLIDRFKNSRYINLAVTPEGTRSATSDWKTGFLYIAQGADVPVVLAVIDYSRKKVIIDKEINKIIDISTSLQEIKNYYSTYSDVAKYPEKFKTI